MKMASTEVLYILSLAPCDDDFNSCLRVCSKGSERLTKLKAGQLEMESC